MSIPSDATGQLAAPAAVTLWAVAGLHRALLVRHDDQLGVLAELGDQAEEPVQVDIVERRLDLVHHVERRGPAAEHGEQERQRRQRPLAT
jgi:hypothetical protein